MSLSYNKHVLIVDDEEMVLEVMGELLDLLGYKCKLCTNGKQALEAIANTPRHFRLAIIDLTLKGNERGEDIAKYIRKTAPETILVACTGYPDHPAMIDPKHHSFDYTLPKPYTIKSLENLLAHC